MFTNQTKAATLSTEVSITPIIEKKLASGVRSEIETGLLFATRLVRMATSSTQQQTAAELVQRAKLSLEIFKLVNGH